MLYSLTTIALSQDTPPACATGAGKATALERPSPLVVIAAPGRFLRDQIDVAQDLAGLGAGQSFH